MKSPRNLLWHPSLPENGRWAPLGNLYRSDSKCTEKLKDSSGEGGKEKKEQKKGQPFPT